MSLPQTIAHYRILSKLGEGGMGEVWRATDTRLNRDVAIKILPEAFAQNPDRMARFTREAQLLASLNHPNIAAIYGVEDRALIMELVEGETLPTHVPFETALNYARQIAEALEYAHEKGIVHRDLKPANIKVTPEGRVKLLDFGLAKAVSNDPTPGDPESSPTLTMSATVAGIMLGTPAYMSPEQARGQPVDRRADIWAFGVVLYEMLTGRRLFSGPTVSDILASVLRGEIDLQPLPPQVRPVIDRCLRRDPKLRWRSIGDVFLALADGPPEDRTAKRSMVPWVVAATLACALAIAAGLLWQTTRPQLHPGMRLSIDLGPDAVVGTYSTVSISPDGTRLAFVERGADGHPQLATRLLSQSRPTLLPGTTDAVDPFFSPDGQSIGFFADGKLKTTSVQGGAPVTLANAPMARGGTWMSDGTIVATLDLSGLFRIASGGGASRPLIQNPTQAVSDRWPQALPGGKAVLLTTGTPGNFVDARIDVITLSTGKRETVLRHAYFGRYLPGGYLVFMRQGTLFGIAFDPDRGETRGAPVPLLDDVASALAGGAAQFDFSQNGYFVYLTGVGAMQARRLAWLDSAGAVQYLPAPPGAYLYPRVSPDGSHLAMAGWPAAPRDLWLYDWRKDTTRRLTFTQDSLDAVWSPDGRYLAFYTANMLGILRAYSGQGPQKLIDSDGITLPSSFSPDGRRLAYHKFSAKTDFDIWTVPLDFSDPDHPKAGKPDLFLSTPGEDRYPAFSPDGHWMAYDSTENGSDEIYVRPFPSGSAKWQISTGGGSCPIWSRDGKQLFYETLDGRIMVADCAASRDSFTAGKPRQWSPRRITTMFPYMNYDIHPDGKRFLVFPLPDAPDEQSSAVHAVFLLNFLDELKRRIP